MKNKDLIRAIEVMIKIIIKQSEEIEEHSVMCNNCAYKKSVTENETLMMKDALSNAASKEK